MKPYKFICLFIFLILLSCNTYTTIVLSGYIYDEETGDAIENAIVSDNDYGMGNFSITNEDGYYCYETYCEEHNIMISADGYTTSSKLLLTPFIPSSDPITLNITLKKNI